MKYSVPAPIYQATISNLEPKTRHAGLILVDCGLAFLCRIVRFREQHAVIAGRLFGFTDAAGLYALSLAIILWESFGNAVATDGIMKGSYLGLFGLGGLLGLRRCRGWFLSGVAC